MFVIFKSGAILNWKSSDEDFPFPQFEFLGGHGIAPALLHDLLCYVTLLTQSHSEDKLLIFPRFSTYYKL